MGNKKEHIRGPQMAWLEEMENGELITLFTKQFFDGDYKKRSAFKRGAYRAGIDVALEMCIWWSSFGVTIRPYQIRPDVWGGDDRGPK